MEKSKSHETPAFSPGEAAQPGIRGVAWLCFGLFSGSPTAPAPLNEGKTGCFPDPCVAVGPGVFPAVATLFRKPEGKHKANRNGVKSFVEPSAGQAP